MLECIYFVVVTLSSVGFGDLTPQTDAMRLFTGAYILVGVGILGTALQLVESALASVAPQLGSPASSDGIAECCVALRALEESLGRSHRATRGCGAATSLCQRLSLHAFSTQALGEVVSSLLDADDSTVAGAPAWPRCPPWQRPCSAHVPSQVAPPGGVAQLCSPRNRLAHWAPQALPQVGAASRLESRRCHRLWLS